MKVLVGGILLFLLLTSTNIGYPGGSSDAGNLEELLREVEVALDAGDMNLAQRLNDRALQLSRKLADDTALLKALMFYNDIQGNNGNYPAVLNNSLHALPLAENSGNSRAAARLHTDIGAAYGILGDNRQSMEHYAAALEIYRTIKDNKGIGGILNNIAVTYDNMGNPDKSQEYFLKSLDLATRIGDREGMALALANLGQQKRTEKYFAEARDMLSRAINILEKDPSLSRGTYLYALTELGRVHYEKQEYAEAARLAQQVRKLAKEYGLARPLFLALELEAMADMELRDYDNARNALNQAVSLAERENMELERIDIYRIQADLEKHQGNYPQALQYLNTYVELIEKFEEQEDIQQAHAAQALFDSGEKQREIIKLRQEQELQKYKLKEQQRNQRWLWGLISLAVLFIGVLILLLQRLNRSRQLIAEKNRALAQAVEKAESLARQDHLTRLLNRRGFLELLEYEKQRQKRHRGPITIVLADIDHFKNINDLHGHQCGDKILVSVARHLASAIREEDSLCRWGGEEFLMMLPDTSGEQAMALIKRIVESLKSRHFSCDGETLTLTLTFGATTCMPEDSIDACISSADNALYEGKRQGRDTVVFAGGTDA